MRTGSIRSNRRACQAIRRLRTILSQLRQADQLVIRSAQERTHRPGVIRSDPRCDFPVPRYSKAPD